MKPRPGTIPLLRTSSAILAMCAVPASTLANPPVYPPVASYYIQPQPVRAYPPPYTYPAYPAQPVEVLQPAYGPAYVFAAPDTSLPASCNLHVFITEGLLNRVMSRTNTDTQPVRNFIQGANVFGMQTTDSQLTVDCQPATGTAQLALQLNGVTRSNTLGVRQEAAVNTLGCYRFSVEKRVFFDGQRFTTLAPLAHVLANNSNRGVFTPVSGTPLLGPLVDRIAYSVAERMRPESQAIGARLLASELVPQFNAEVDKELSNLNHQIRTAVRAPLHAANVLPGIESVASTDTYLRYSAGLRSQAETELQLGQPPTHQPGKLLTVCIHESLLNNAIERGALGGRSLTENELRRLAVEIRSTLERFELAEPTSPAPEDAATLPPVTIVLDESDPLRVEIADGQVTVIVRAHIEPESGPALPPHELSVPLTAVLGEAVTFELGEVGLVPLDDSGPDLSALLKPLIRQQIDLRLREVKLPRTWSPEIPGAGQLSLTCREIIARDGWLVIAYD